MMNPEIAIALSRIICNYEMTPDAYSLLYCFYQLPCHEICKIRRIFYQRYYYYQTRCSLFAPMCQSEFLNQLPKLTNVNISNPNNRNVKIIEDHFTNDLYQTIAYMRLFFGYVPHSTRNI